MLAACALFGSVSAQAAGTIAGTSIDNKATLNYSVGGVSQGSIGSSPGGNTSGAGTNTSFVVDDKVNLSVVTLDGGPQSSVPGQTGVTTTFKVTNTGNSTKDFALATGDVASGATVLTATDNLNVNGACGVDAGSGASSISNLAPDQSVTVLVTCAIPATAADKSVAAVYLKATAMVAGSGAATALTETGTNDPTKVDIVFADTAGTDDGNRDASFSARSAYQVSTAALSVKKTVSSVCDPLNGPTNASNVPGAYVQYTITITNSATASSSATLTQISDALASTLVFDNDFIQGATAAACVSGTGSTPTNAAGNGVEILQTNRGATYPKFLTSTATDADGAGVASNTLTVDFSKALPAGENSHAAGELKPGESVSVVFQAQIK